MTEEAPEHWRTLYQLLLKHSWTEAKKRCELYPQEAQHIDFKFGWTPLHLVCHFGSSPSHLVETIAAAHPKAISQKDRRFGDTPFHIQCRNSQRSVCKVKSLLHHDASNEAVLIRNKMGHTPLHTACCTNAMIEVLTVLIESNPAILINVDYQGETPLHSLWQTYIQSIPGHLTVAKILREENYSLSNSFERFWDKVKFVALSRYRMAGHPSQDAMLGHALLQCSAPTGLIFVALRLDPNLSTVLDGSGNTMLHSIVRNQSMQRRSKMDLIAFILKLNPRAAAMEGQNCCTPLETAIGEGLSWKDGLSEILSANPSVLQRVNKENKLVPFLQAACTCDLDTIYELLTSQPDAIQA